MAIVFREEGTDLLCAGEDAPHPINLSTEDSR